MLSAAGAGRVSSRSGPSCGLHCSSGSTVPSGSVMDLGGEYIAMQPLTTDYGGRDRVSNDSSIIRGQAGQAGDKTHGRKRCATGSAEVLTRWLRPVL